MIKGGFQGLDISGVDLTAQSPTLPGGYAACAAADGKTVLVLTAAGAVQCSVKKVSTNYVLAGITGDGKILSITIGSTDGISVSESVPGEISGNIKAGSETEITNASTSDPFIVPADGYITLRKNSEDPAGSTLTLDILRKTSGVSAIASLYGAPDAASGQAFIYARTFVKKGSVVKIGRPVGASNFGKAFYLPLEVV